MLFCMDNINERNKKATEEKPLLAKPFNMAKHLAQH